jgi:hypothetical protein
MSRSAWRARALRIVSTVSSRLSPSTFSMTATGRPLAVRTLLLPTPVSSAPASDAS